MKFQLKALLAAGAVLAAVGAAAWGGAAQPANAASSTSCGGTLVRTVTLSAATGNTLGQGQLYKNNNGGFCAMTVHTGSFAGKATYTGVDLEGLRANGQEATGASDADWGTYVSYAGPVRVNAPCVSASFYMQNAQGNHGGQVILAYGCNAGNNTAVYHW